MIVSPTIPAYKAAATSLVTGRFNQLEAEYERLVNMENQEYNKLKANADAAAARLAEKEAQKAQIEERIAKIEAAADSKAFKAQYADLAKQYKAVVKALDTEIKSLNTTVENFAAIESLKGNQ
ncbi:MAG: adhesion protein FadA [Leptotrichia wadei]